MNLPLGELRVIAITRKPHREIPARLTIIMLNCVDRQYVYRLPIIPNIAIKHNDYQLLAEYY
jgi:hypothetical protein